MVPTTRRERPLGQLLDLQCAPSDVGVVSGRSVPWKVLCIHTARGRQGLLRFWIVLGCFGVVIVLCECWCGGGVTQMLAAMSSGGTRNGLKGGASNVTEGDVVGHFERHTSSKCADLFMYVHEKGGRAPTSHFLDSWCVKAIQVHGHGTPRSQ